ncbi:hypothetical protein AK37_03488, partial [Rhodococcus pyridinivorans AK37]
MEVATARSSSAARRTRSISASRSGVRTAARALSRSVKPASAACGAGVGGAFVGGRARLQGGGAGVEQRGGGGGQCRDRPPSRGEQVEVADGLDDALADLRLHNIART